MMAWSAGEALGYLSKADIKQIKSEQTIPPEKLGDYLRAAAERGVLPMFYLELASGLHRGKLLALQSGIDPKTVSGMLGHYSAEFTLDIYTNVTKEMQKEAAKRIGGFMADVL